MALVKCPECGREKVSQSATSCPTCGYNIKSHFERIQQFEQQRKQAENRRRIQRIRMSKVEMPKKPENEWEINEIILAVAGICCTFFGLLFLDNKPVFFLISGIGVFIYYQAVSQKNAIYNKKMRDYNLAMKDFEEYQKQVIKEEDAAAERKEKEEAMKPTCPVCGSKYVKRIDMVNRAISVELTGLASSKIGKQYQCRKCKHLW